MRNPVSPAFALTLYFRFLTGMSRTLGALDFLSRAYRPSRAAHQSVFPENEVSHAVTRWQCYIVAYRWTEIQRLTAPAYAMKPRPHSNDRLPQSSTGSSLPSEGLWPIHHNSRFAGFHLGTVEESLSHSCGSTINRQGITLP